MLLCHLAKLEIANGFPVSIRTNDVKYSLSVMLAEPKLCNKLSHRTGFTYMSTEY